MEEHKDFLATELLHELKLESERKDRQLGNLHKILTGIIIGALCAIMMYSDYASVADKYGVSSAKFYGELAKAFLWDPDGPGAEEKLAIYAHKIAGVK